MIKNMIQRYLEAEIDEDDDLDHKNKQKFRIMQKKESNKKGNTFDLLTPSNKFTWVNRWEDLKSKFDEFEIKIQEEKKEKQDRKRKKKRKNKANIMNLTENES